MLFSSRHPRYEFLRKKWIAKHKTARENLFEKHSRLFRHFTLGSLGGLLMLSVPGISHLPTQLSPQSDNSYGQHIELHEDKNSFLANKLKPVLPPEVRKLTADEDANIVSVLSDTLHLSVSPQLEGIRLNRTYGLIGGEQHLYRYPGDNLTKHSTSASEWAMYSDAGIAPGLGAWGYFTPSEKALTDEMKQREKYYLAVQTFLAPGFAENVSRYRDFFKFRKMVIINPNNGKVVVGDIADAGPSETTGKHLGGSPEVMEALGLAGGPRKGAVLYYFIDDPENKVPLGPIELK